MYYVFFFVVIFHIDISLPQGNKQWDHQKLRYHHTITQFHYLIRIYIYIFIILIIVNLYIILYPLITGTAPPKCL